MALVLDGDNGIVGVLATNNDGDVIFDTDTLFVDAVENKVGIGTTSPVRQLHLASAIPSIRLEDTDVSGAYNDIVLLSTGELSIRVDQGNVQAGSSLSFRIDNTEKMRIDSSGRVGIGTPSPDNYYAKDLVVTSADEGGITMASSGANQQQYLMFADGTSGGERYRGYIGYDHASEHMQMTSGGILRFLVNETAEVMRITTTGIIQGVSDAEIATSPIRTHSNTISTNTTIDANDNAVASGPLGIADGVTLTINGNMTVV